MHVIIYYTPWSAVVTLFYKQAAMPALIIYYMYVSTFVWVLPYVRSRIASLLVRMLVVLLYLLFIIIHMHVYLRCYLEIYDRTLWYERPSIGYNIANIYMFDHLFDEL